MNDKTDELLSELDAMRDNTPPTSQADHLLQALKSRGAPIEESDPTSSPDIDEVDDLLELMNDGMVSEETAAPKSVASHSTANTASISEVEAVALALEAAKAAQEAAENSQKSSELAIKSAHELKAEVIELSDSNYAWRQLVKSATKEIKTTKNIVSLLATISIIFSIAAAGIMGYYLYSLNKKYEQLKGEVLDIIQTENSLFQKKFSTKVDELSSLIEFLSTKIEKISITSGVQPHTPPIITHSDTRDAKSTGKVFEHHQNHTPLRESHSITPPSEDYSADLNEIKQVIQSILHKQQSLESLINQAIQENKDGHAPSHSAPTLQHSNQTIMAKLSPEDDKKLAAILWLIKKQSKQIKQIQSALKQKTHSNASKNHGLESVQNTLKAIQQQVRALQEQQDELKKELQSLKQETRKLSTNRPYIYRAPNIEP